MEVDVDEWSRRFAQRMRAGTTRLTPEEALAEGRQLYGLLGPDMTPEEAADAILANGQGGPTAGPAYRGGARVR